ncbi:hypothetical protein [Chryseobacterium sp. BIGb0232]|uniref:hypothetical protein n=1 Tax=Chryseobacterium sp. BIGb0232 TaxID=2940598 RepID=UPI000FA40DBC|nr:hypothetical protein [Chryseobacterium sp. BIGb0232]MCS4302643.1 GH43 family beta-xylosidase [Chryseobacterium sp. BIGb0232]ROS17297.1 hypothetical protein EDF65_1661 [Chryseobacterium nakagawai]
MNIKSTIMIFIITIFFTGCKIKSQCNIYSSIINKSIKSDYNKFLKENVSKIKAGEIKIDPLEYYINFNSCNRKNILFSFPKDSIFVMENNVDDDYAGTIVNSTSIYKNNKVFFFRSTNQNIDSLNLDKDYILNNSSYAYILKLKQGKLLRTKVLQNSKCIPLKDMTYISLIVDKKLKKIYRVCSEEFVGL